MLLCFEKTSLLVEHWLQSPKPLFLLDGTLAARLSSYPPVGLLGGKENSFDFSIYWQG